MSIPVKYVGLNYDEPKTEHLDAHQKQESTFW